MPPPSSVTTTCVACVPVAPALWAASGCGVVPLAVAVNEHFDTSRPKVTVVASPARVDAVAPFPARSVPPSATAANSRSPAAAKSVESLSSSLSALRFATLPVALVVNGTPVVSLTRISPPSLPPVSNSNARPVERLLARTHGSALPASARQP